MLPKVETVQKRRKSIKLFLSRLTITCYLHLKSKMIVIITVIGGGGGGGGAIQLLSSNVPIYYVNLGGRTDKIGNF